MKNTSLLLLFLSALVMVACDKDEEEEVSERFLLLTTPVWVSNELLINGEDASEGLLANFRGEARFEADGTGNFGEYTGTWEFLQNETQLRISPVGFPVIIANIVSLTDNFLEIVTGFPNPQNPAETFNITMNFNAM